MNLQKEFSIHFALAKFFGLIGLLYLIWINSHWSVGVFCTLIAIKTMVDDYVMQALIDSINSMAEIQSSRLDKKAQKNLDKFVSEVRKKLEENQKDDENF